MRNEELQSKLDEIWGSTIINLDFDILKNQILMELETVENGTKLHHKIKLMDVSAYFFVNNVHNSRKVLIPYEVGDYLELTSISLIDMDVNMVTDSEEKWIEQYKASANIAVEIWSRFLFIEAKRINLNGKDFNLTT
jgi:hypothetical protein